MSIAIGIASEINTAGAIGIAMIPKDQERDWQARFRDAERVLREIATPQSSTLSGDAITACRDKLHGWFVQAYHIKDALKQGISDGNVPGVTGVEVEQAISSDAHLSLLADLANLDKHGALNRAPRSGHVPSYGILKGTKDGSGATWALDLKIEHNCQSIDAVDFAHAAMAAWRIHLQHWRLLS